MESLHGMISHLNETSVNLELSGVKAKIDSYFVYLIY